MQYTEQELFQRLSKLETDKLTITEDINQLKKDFTFHADDNPGGVSKEDVKLTHAAAKLQAKNDFDEKKAQADAVFEKYVELSGYNK